MCSFINFLYHSFKKYSYNQSDLILYDTFVRDCRATEFVCFQVKSECGDGLHLVHREEPLLDGVPKYTSITLKW